jgi:uncharacterized protein (DUF58 family)
MEEVENWPGLPGPQALPALRLAARRWTGLLRLPLRHRRWRGSSGEFAGIGVGSSLEFQDHRAYQPGDDPRQINWQAYARTGQYSMKLYREEVRPLVDVALDVSDSMWAFAGKADRTAELLYFAVEGAGRAGASVRVFAIDGAVVHPLSEASIASDRWAGEVAAAFTPASDAPRPPHAVPVVARIPFRPGSLRILVSDLLFPGTPESVVHPLVAGQGRGVILAPAAPEETTPDWQGNCEFIDAEARTRHPHRLTPERLTHYTDAYRRHFDLWKDAALRHGVALARVPATGDLGAALRTEAVAAGAVEF